MCLLKKPFLLFVGVITTAFDEVSKTIEEAIESVEAESKKLNQRLSKPNR